MARPMGSQMRLRWEWSQLHQNQPSNWWAWPVSGDLMQWEAAVKGARGTPYFLGIFELKLQFSRNYPFEAPRVNFATKIYHFNIDYDGYICWDLLSTRWTTAERVTSIMQAVCDLMARPNADIPCDETMAALYRDNRELYNNNAANWTRRYAIPPSRDVSPIPSMPSTPTMPTMPSTQCQRSRDNSSDLETAEERAGVDPLSLDAAGCDMSPSSPS